MAGKKLADLGFTREIWTDHWAVKESVFPFNRFHGQDILLSPEMRSTGEVMGLDADFGIAYAKSQMAANAPLPLSGRVFISVSDADKKQVAAIAQQFVDLGFEIVCHRRDGERPGVGGADSFADFQIGRRAAQRAGFAQEPGNSTGHQHSGGPVAAGG